MNQIAWTTNLKQLPTVSKDDATLSKVAPPAASGGAGPQFEGKVGAFYLLSLLIGSEPRGLPGAATRTVAFQQRESGRPLDDVVIHAVNTDGSQATFEIQAKRSLSFTPSDAEFTDVVAQMWAAVQKSEFQSTSKPVGAPLLHARRHSGDRHHRLRDLVEQVSRIVLLAERHRHEAGDLGLVELQGQVSRRGVCGNFVMFDTQGSADQGKIGWAIVLLFAFGHDLFALFYEAR